MDEDQSTATPVAAISGGAMTGKGHSDRFVGTLDLAAQPAWELIVDAESLDPADARREHLCARDFFTVEEQPEFRIASDGTELDGVALKVRGDLYAAGERVPVELDATLHTVDGTVALDAVTKVDHRALGVPWSPLGLTRRPATLIVHGRLVRGTAASCG